MSDFLTTREVADLLRLKDRKVYDLAARGEIPCVKATGKLLFSRTEILNWLDQSNAGVSTSAALPAVILGSHDPLLEWALGASEASLATLLGGSLDGLSRLAAGEGLAAGVHIQNTSDNDWNLEVVNARFAARPVILMHWARRMRGLIVRPDAAVNDLKASIGLRWAMRQPQSGSQQQLNRLFTAADLDLSTIQYVREARNETEAVLALVEGQADVTFGLGCFADRYDLAFIPMIEESFDLLIDRHGFCEPPFQKLLQFTRSRGFSEECHRYSGYDVSHLGQIVFNGPRTA